MLTHRQIDTSHDLKDLLAFQVQGNFQFPEYYIVSQTLFRFRLRSRLSPPSLVNQAIEKNGKLAVAAVLTGRVIIFFQPIAYLAARHRIVRRTKNCDHLGITQVKTVADTAQYIVIIQGNILQR